MTKDPAPRILVVDDSVVVRDLIALNLALEGFEVVTAANAAEALGLVASLRPAAITLDVMMGQGPNGFEVLAELKSDPDTRDIPVVMLTGRAHPDDMALGEELGADAFIAKPFEPADLVDVVRRLAPGADTLDR